jgi:polysaccharide biosynthesis protein PslH
MRILQIASRIPYPLTDGGQVCLFNTMKYLALRGHKITLLTYANEEIKDLEPILEVCDLKLIRKSTKDSLLKGFFNLFSDVPYKISKYISKELEMVLTELLKPISFDIVIIEQLHMAYYGLLCKRLTGLPIILREENVESVIVERYVETKDIPLIRNYLRTQLKRIRRYEAEKTALFDICCMITEEDRKKLQALNPLVQTCVIAAGVEASYFSKIPSVDKVPHSICFFGGYAWPANKDGVLWFLEKIFPRVLEQIPDAKFFLIGKDISTNIKHYRNKNVIVRGFVSDLKQELSQYVITIAPIRVGSGIRLKILESFAMQIPVVTTSIGCEGIQATDSEHLLIGDTVDEFAEQVVRLLSDKELRNRITMSAYALARQKYRWEQIAEQFENMCKEFL